MRRLCLPYGLSEEDIAKLSDIVSAHRKVYRGAHVYHIGERFEALYAVCKGFFKTDILLDDGRAQVTGFQMSGDLLGLDGIGEGTHLCDAIALEDSQICVIPFQEVERLSHELPALQHQLHKILSKEIAREQTVMTLLGTMHAQERLAIFLLNLSQRLAARGAAPHDFYLPMTRSEIGSYLGLKLETVSRIFSRFQDDGWISVQKKHVRLLDPNALKILAHQTPH